MSAVDRADVTLKHTPVGFPRGYRITCCKCGFWTDVNLGNISGGMPPAMVARKVRQRGWEVPKGFDTAICAKCAEAMGRRPKPKPKPKLVPVEVKPHVVSPEVEALLSQWGDEQLPSPNLVPDNDLTLDRRPMPETATVTPIRADQPRTMTRADRQVIFSKLQDAYPKEEAGYTQGWSDDKVAKDLGVPKGWVALVRDENFGPATVGPSVEEQFAAYRREMEAEVSVLRDRLAALQGSINAASKDAAEMASAVLTLSRRVVGKPS